MNLLANTYSGLTTTLSSLRLFPALALSVSLLATPVASAAGLLKPNNAAYADLKIKQHHVDVVIEDMYATTTVEQVFHNPNSTDLEAIYSFPVPENAAVGEFSYWINGQPVTGEVVEKQRARQIYTDQKQQGREAAIVEKDEYKTFDIAVTPVKANQDVRIKLVYLQNTQTDTGIGRYVYPLEEGGVDEKKLSFWNRNEFVEEKFSFNAKLRTSYPVDGLRLPRHPNANVNQTSDHEWRVNLVNSEAENTVRTDEQNAAVSSQDFNPTRLNEDILLYWRHTPDLPASVDMIAYKEQYAAKGTYKLTLTPGSDLPLISQGRDWIFVLDISGSMRGKFAALIEGIRAGLTQLPATDRFRIVLFNNQTQSFTKGYLPADPQTITEVLRRLDQIQPGNGTNLYAGLRTGIDNLDADRSSALILVTDGVANVGNTQKSQFLTLLQQNDIRLFTFIMGNSANRPLLEEMTRVSNGFAMSISNADDIAGQLMLVQGKMSHAAMRDIEIKVTGVRSKGLVTPRLSNTLYHGQQLNLFGQYYQPGEAEIELSGYINGKKKIYSTRFTLPEAATDHPELERLWAFATIAELQAEIDYLGGRKDTEQAIIDTAVEYGLVTDYTSMIVLRDEVFNALNIERNNQQRVSKEQQARNHRKQQTLVQEHHRVDAQKPMFTDSTATQPNQSQQRQTVTPNRYGNGGGAISPWLVVLIASSITLIQFRRFKPETVNKHK